MTRRLLGSVIVLGAILLLPYWVYLPVLFAAIVILPFFWEGIWWAFLIDVLYGQGIANPLALVSLLSLTTLAVLIIILPVKERLRLYV